MHLYISQKKFLSDFYISFLINGNIKSTLGMVLKIKIVSVG